MKTYFLCSTHRQWLTHNLTAATNHYHSCIDTAQFYFDNGCWNEAIPYYGCALETAEILLSKQTEQQSLLDFTHGAISLANAFFKSGRVSERQRTFELAKARLHTEIEQLPLRSPHQQLLLDCYAALDMGLKRGLQLLSTDEMDEQQHGKQTHNAFH